MASVGGDGGDSLSLNVMPMLDIFSILILFLLMNFSSDPMSHDVDGGIELPRSKTIRALDEVPAVLVSKKIIRVQEKKVSVVVNGDVPKSDMRQGAIFPMFKALEKLAKATKRLKKKKDKNVTPLTLEMDKGHSFKLLKRVMLSAQQAEYVAFKLMVSKKIN